MLLLQKQTVPFHGLTAPALLPFDADGEETLAKMRDGQICRVEAKRARHPEHHAKFFAILHKVFENQEQFASEDALRQATLIEIGCCEIRQRFDGTQYKVAKSMNWHAMGQEEFETVYNAALDLWCQHFGMDRELLENEIGYRP